MADIGSITGIENVLKNLALRTEQLGVGCEMGLKAAGLYLQRESQRLVPVDLGDLKASAFTRQTGKGYATTVNVGYTANYALYVHESVGMVLKGLPRTGKDSKGRYWDPQGRGQAKFLEEPARRLAPEMKAIIAARMRL